mgnify:CR=1 FL=1
MKISIQLAVSFFIFIIGELILLSIIGAVNNITLGDLNIIRDYVDLAMFLIMSSLILLASLSIGLVPSNNNKEIEEIKKWNDLNILKQWTLLILQM